MRLSLMILAAGVLLILTGCGGGGSTATKTSAYAATYEARITGENTQANQVTGTVSMTVSPKGAAAATVYDGSGNVLANLTGTLINAGATLTDTTGNVVFYANFMLTTTATFAPGNTVICPVCGVFGTWSDSQNGSSGNWSSTVPTVATPLTTAQATSIEAGCAAEGNNQIFNPLVATSTDLCQLGAINPNEPAAGMYSYTDSQGNVYSVLITSTVLTDSSNKSAVDIYIYEILPIFNLNVVSSWPSASVTLASFDFFQVMPGIVTSSKMTRPAR